MDRPCVPSPHHAAAFVASIALATIARAAVITNAADNYRTGWYRDQPSLTPALVSGPDFMQRFSTPVDGQVYGQPLVAKNSLVVVTETNWVYRLEPETGRIQWGRQLGPPWNPADLSCGDLTPWIGITSTPVVDEATRTIYLFSKSYASGTSGPAIWYAHALDLITGDERPAFPVEIRGSNQNGGAQVFDPTHQLQRPGLLFLDGVVYAGFGGHCDVAPWQGWIAGVSMSGLLESLWTSRASAGGNGAAIWQSGGGLVSDGAGRIIVATGNGGAPVTPIPGSAPPANLGESVVRLQVQGDGTLSAADFFTPSNAHLLDLVDGDLGSGAPLALPEPYFGTATYPHLAVEVGKEGVVYMLNRDHLGGCKQGPAQSDDVLSKSNTSGGVWARPTAWPGDGGYVYIPVNGAPLRVFQYGIDGTGKPILTLVASSTDNFGFGSSSTVVTSDGTTTGSALVWVNYMPDGSGANAQLRAYDALPVAGAPVLRFSAPIGTASKFNPPGVAMGRIYVGARDGHVLMFGPPLISLTLSKNIVAGSVHLEWTGGNAPFTLTRAEDPDFNVNSTVLLDGQSVTSYDDPVLNDGKDYFYRVR